MTNSQNVLTNYSVRITDNYPHPFAVVHVELDEEGNPCDWIFLYCNESCAKLVDASKEELIGQHLSKFFPTVNRNYLNPYYEAAYEGKTFSYEFISEDNDRYLNIELFPTDEKGTCIQVLRDIKENVLEKIARNEELQQTVEKLEDEKRINAQVQQYASALGVVYPLAIYLDYLNNEYHMLEYEQFLNKTANWSGTVDELIEVGASTIPDEEYADQFKNLFGRESALAAFRAGENELTLQHPQIGDDGKIHWMETKVICMECTESKVEAISISKCIDETKQIADARAKLQERDAIFTALSADYDEVYICDIDADTLRVLKSADLAAIETEGKYSEIGRYFFKNKVLVQSSPDMLEKLSRKGLKSYLSSHDELSIRYELKADEQGRRFCETRFVHVPSDTGFWVVIGTHFIDDIIQERMAQEAETKLHYQIISALGREYSPLYLVDTVTRQWQILNAENLDMAKATMDGKIHYEDFDIALDFFINKFIVEEEKADMLVQMNLTNILENTPEIGIHSLNYDRMKDGVRQHWQMNSAKFTADDGNTYLVLGFRDVHAIVEKQLKEEAALRDALMVAKHATRAKSTFLSNMSHDIRTPMNAIIGYTALAEAHLEDSDQVRDYLSKIHTSSTHLLSLINEILDMSRIESGTVKLEENAVHIPDVLHDLRTMIQGQIAAKQQHLYIDALDVRNEDVVTDKLRLNQVLLNIVSNAMKYTEVGGNIMIRVQEEPCAMKGYATYQFSVKDNGRGMSPEYVEHIFEVFSRERTSTTSGIQGTGLGMSITKNIVDLMNGTITVNSELGVGSEFVVTVDFKIAEELVEYTLIPELVGARALVVDDDVMTCQSVSKMLRDIKMRPDWSTSGSEAIIRAKEATDIKDEYKAYIIDYLMPDMNGIETVRQIRNVISEEVPIIVLTAYDWTEFEEEAKAAGVTAFVAKPIFMSDLRKVLSKPCEETESPTDTIEQYDYSGKHVLLVEDNELNREIATAILEETNMTIDTASDGTEAVEIMYKASSDQYDLIFMDIQMPKMDGYTATKEIRTFADNKKANIPIVAMTANAFEEDRKKAFEAGMNGHITKPISIDAIAKVLDDIFA